MAVQTPVERAGYSVARIRDAKAPLGEKLHGKMKRIHPLPKSDSHFTRPPANEPPVFDEYKSPPVGFSQSER